MGGIVRMVSTGRKAILPSMIGLGVAWVIVGLVSLYSALVTGEADPTVWAPQVAGPVGGIFVLLFIAVANIGSTLVGAYIATLGISQISKVRKKLPWRAIAALTMLPMALVLILFPEPFYDRVGIFMAFIGIMVAPLIGIQIADWFYLKRLKNLKISSLYQEGSRSVYWYWHGFNPAGILALVVGSMTYMAILDPVLFTPRSWLFGYLTASLPCVLVSAFVYAVLSRAMFERDIRKKSVGGGG
ncbi:hypothetical protein ASF72_19325 [Arthrobacter sp. Leaf141]|nr:hypothetical protein ASF72_19325 [Arthrobacter sp. Leaf141]